MFWFCQRDSAMLDPSVGGELALRLADSQAQLRSETLPPQQPAENERPRKAIGRKQAPGRRAVDDAGKYLGRR
jgi:hypothetical protein